ncbi:MAG: bis(5'-nucleosyl)-tetraphosphatase (symmetrical) YqeK [Alicyclobacillus sp.]|nr:bis(5'-nucleosyl)-tetraphosphatase (symmetrical) YqeK [Alicyclobacillus sp.]
MGLRLAAHDWESGGKIRVLEEEIRQKARAELSDKRFQHVTGVVETAATLAARFGVSVEKARCAAWLHDIAREWPADRLLQYAERNDTPSGFATIPMLLHGPVAAILGKEWFHIDDVEILNAVRYHTTGRPGMGKLEQVLYVADAIEPGRVYEGVDTIRQTAAADLLAALVQTVDSTLRYLLDKGKPIFPLTVMARNEWLDALQARHRTERQETE